MTSRDGKQADSIELSALLEIENQIQKDGDIPEPFCA
jgi:hypothetical protein